jgi:hypothetical protein
MARRLLVPIGVVVGLIVAALVAGAAYTALKAPLATQPNSNLNPDNCSPGPCANLNGFTIWVSKVRVANDIVHLTVKFQNMSTATHVAPEDLNLIDTGRRSSIPISGIAGCKSFTRHEFSGSNQTFGPLDLCFRVASSTPPFILHWTPDLGTFSPEQDITLWPS